MHIYLKLNYSVTHVKVIIVTIILCKSVSSLCLCFAFATDWKAGRSSVNKEMTNDIT